MDDGWVRCCRKGGGWQYRHEITGELSFEW